MGLKVKIDPVEKFTAASIRADLSLAEQRKAAAEFAAAGIAEADQVNQRILGRIPPKTVTVDGRKGASLNSVNPDGGTIIVEYDIVADVLRWIARTLFERSPESSGAYKRGHTLFADGAETAVGGNLPPAEEYVFLNQVPYARKIEVGKTKSGRSFLMQVPNRIYERTAKDAKSRFGADADIQFAYRATTGAYRLRKDQASRHFLKGGRIYHEPTIRSDRKSGSVVSSPSIIVRNRRS